MLRKLVPQSTSARNVITLMTGTAFAQALPIAVRPVLTCLYTPAAQLTVGNAVAQKIAHLRKRHAWDETYIQRIETLEHI